MEDDTGYYLLLIAILKEVDLNQANMLYKYGPAHEKCKKFLNKKPAKVDTQGLSKEDITKEMRRLRSEGHSYHVIADACNSNLSAVRRRLGKRKEN